MECRKCWKEAGPLMGMICVQLISAGLQILSRVILSQGTFIFALIAYRHAFAALCIAPFALFLETGKGAKLTVMVVFWVFLSSLTGITMGMGMFYYGLRDTTATYATNFLNLIPIVTFFFSVLAGMEKLDLKMTKGRVRIAGAIVCVLGAIIISLHRGETFHVRYVHHQTTNWLILTRTEPHRARGTSLLAASVLSYGTWFIVQVKLLKSLPFKYWATMLTCISASIQTAIVGLCLDRSKSAWKLGWDLQLITIVYSGVLASAATFCLISWAVSIRGPSYPAMFNPLGLVFVAITEVLLLGEDLTSGSILGMVVIVMGLYSFLWGSKKDMKTSSPLPSSISVKGCEAEGVVETLAIGRSQLTATVVPTTSVVSHSGEE